MHRKGRVGLSLVGRRLAPTRWLSPRAQEGAVFKPQRPRGGKERRDDEMRGEVLEQREEEGRDETRTRQD